MNHAQIAEYISPFESEFEASSSRGKPYVMGETNSATQGGGGISPTFGAGLWVMDYIFQSLILGFKALYFHQGTIGNCQYCWWSTSTINSPYYGAYFAALALAHADQIAPLDNASTPYAAYAIYSESNPVKVLLYNSDYYASGTRTNHTFIFTGLHSKAVAAKRLTAPYATSRQDEGENPTIGGQSFGNLTCGLQGEETWEKIMVVEGGEARFVVGASEALLIYL